MTTNAELAQFGHHPDTTIDAEIEVGRLQGLLSEARAGLLRALDFNAASPEGLAIKRDVRSVLERLSRPDEEGDHAG